MKKLRISIDNKKKQVYYMDKIWKSKKLNCDYFGNIDRRDKDGKASNQRKKKANCADGYGTGVHKRQGFIGLFSGFNRDYSEGFTGPGTKNIINKGHGDATISSTYQENPFDMKVYTHIESKAKIAEKAVGLIPEGGVVMVDSGSTNMQVAKLLNLKNGLVVVTNSLSAAQVLSGTSNQLLVIGGELRSKSLSL